MKKKSLLWISALLLMLAGCNSSDDDITINDLNILGYWKSEATYNNPWGLIFVSNGEIKTWEYSLLADTGYSEGHWGYFWFDDEGTLEIQDRPKDSDPNPDELYYKVMSLTKDRLVIRVFGGFAGTPFEKGEDMVYQKMTSMPYK